MCGVLGIIGPPGWRAFEATYDGLLAIQHRGQDAAGITTIDGRKLHTRKDLGLVQDIFRPADASRLTGPISIAQVRYPTFGSGSADDAQPFVLHYPYGIVMAHNGQVTNFVQLKEQLERESRRLIDSGCDVEIILHVFADELARLVPSERTPTFAEITDAVEGVHKRVRGAYSVICYIVGVGFVAFRDPFGIRPLALGTREIAVEGSEDRAPEIAYAIASESAAIDAAGFEHREEVKPGEVILITAEREIHRAIPPTAREARPCIFEYVYFARPDSLIADVSVYHARVRQGQKLADAWRKTGIEVDAIVSVPESARIAAVEMAMQLGVKYREGLIKNRYIGRTFIMPGNVDRRRAIRRKLNTVDLVFDGQDVLLVDDSIVRGNTVRELIRMVREAGAHRVYFACHSAPVVNPCVYGIDMSTNGEFIARDKRVDEIRDAVGADHLLYLEQDEMVKGTRKADDDAVQFCTACFGGSYPTGDVDRSILADFARDRGAHHAAPAT